jgi:hypothetical protein
VSLLHQHNMSGAALSIGRCNGPHSRCRNRLCIVCISLNAINARRSLKAWLRSTFKEDPRSLVWAISPKPIDAAIRHRERALALVSGVRHFVRRLPVKDWFACTEVERCSLGDSSLNIHAHGILALKPPKPGRNYIRHSEWPERLEEAWQSATPYASDCHSERLLAPLDGCDWASYITKPATIGTYAITVSELFSKPERFFEHAEAMRGVARFFGSIAPD